MTKTLNTMYKCIISGLIMLILPFALPAAELPEDRAQQSVLRVEPEVRLSGRLYSFNMDSDGSYYLKDNWVKGSVTLTNGETAEGVLLNYNTYLGELIWLSEETYRVVQVDKNLVKQFTLDQPGVSGPAVFQRLRISMPLEGDSANIYVQQLYKGDIMLAVRRRVVVTGERLESTRGTLRSVPRLRSDPVYYIIAEGSDAYEISRLNRRSLYSIFPEKRREIRAGFRDERLYIRTEQDLIRAVSVIDSIL